MSESFWVKLTYKEYVGHYCEMTDAEIVADVRKSIGSFSNDRDDGNDFGAKMVRKANARMNGEAAGASRANGQKGGRPKKLTAAATTREGVDVLYNRESGLCSHTTGCNTLTEDAATREGAEAFTSRESGAAAPTTVSRNMRRVPQNEAPAHGFSGGDRAAQGPMSRSPEAAAQSGKDYDQVPYQVSANTPAGAGANLDSTQTISPDASDGNAEGVNSHGLYGSHGKFTTATSGQTIEALEQPRAGEVPPENVYKKPSPALPVPAKRPHGEFGNVLLTDDEFDKLTEKMQNAQDLIDELDQYIESQGKTKKYKSHYATLLNWSRRKAQEAKPQQRYKNINDINQENYEKAMREIEAMCAGEAV